MLNLVYLWLIDENDLFIIGFCLMFICMGFIELCVVNYYVWLFIDNNIGKLMGICFYILVKI